MAVVALACLILSISVLSIHSQPTIESETCSSSFPEAVYSAVMEIRQEQHLYLQRLENLTEELKSFIRSAFVQPINTVPGHEQDRGMNLSKSILCAICHYYTNA